MTTEKLKRANILERDIEKLKNYIGIMAHYCNNKEGQDINLVSPSFFTTIVPKEVQIVVTETCLTALKARLLKLETEFNEI